MNISHKSLPAIAVRGIVPVPNNDLRIEVGRSKALIKGDSTKRSFLHLG